MRLKYGYILYIIVIHLTFGGLAYHFLHDDIMYFMAAELIIIVSLSLAYRLYLKMIKPIQLVQSGSSALLDNDFSIKYVETGSKDLDGLIKVYNSMIDKLRIERTRVQEQSYFLEKLIEVSPIGMIIMDYDQKVTEINPTAMQYLGLKKNPTGIQLSTINSEFIQSLSQLEINESKVIKGLNLQKFKCRLNHVVHLGFPRRFILIEDLSTELMRSEKEAYGKVIRMMAHEVNNSMGAINSILNTVVEFAFEGEEDPDITESLKVAIDRNHNLALFVDNFADIIRLPEPNLKASDLNEITTKASKIWHSKAADQNTKITLDLSDNVMAKIDPILIEQVLSNIIKNSLESIKNGGFIEIKSTAQPPGIYITDNGAGISPKIKDKLFTPFFSTKTNGQGIGLMLIREILMKHEADFSLRSSEDRKTTTFSIQFKK